MNEHGFRPPSNDRAKKFSKGKNSGPSGKEFSIPQMQNLPERPKPPKLETSKLFAPQHDLVLLEVLSNLKTEGGIYLPDSAQSHEQTTIVIATGPGRMTEYGILIKPPCAPGDRVFVAPAPGQAIIIKVQGRDMVLLQSLCILGVYPSEQPVTQSTEPSPD